MSQRLLPLEVPDEPLSCFDELPVPLLSPLHLPLDVPLGLECVPLDESFASPLDELRARCMQSWRSLAPDMFLHICIASADEPLPPSLLVPAPELFPPAVLSWLDGRVLGVVRSVGWVGGVDGEAVVPGAVPVDVWPIDSVEDAMRAAAAASVRILTFMMVL